LLLRIWMPVRILLSDPVKRYIYLAVPTLESITKALVVEVLTAVAASAVLAPLTISVWIAHKFTLRFR
jgi:hypothetical protein